MRPIIPIETEVFWLGHYHGYQGLPRRDLYAGRVSKAYQGGYDGGLRSFEMGQPGKGKPKWSQTRTASRVFALLDEIQSHEDVIAGLKKQITRLEAQS